MKRIFTMLSATFVVASLTCCGQTVSPQKAKDVSAVFLKDVVPNDLSKYKQATLAAGCFWHEQTLFESIKGVVCVVPGYAGGGKTWPKYEDVEKGTTGHAESVNIYYDSTKISYATLLDVYFDAMEDPTQVNGQGADEGTQYRSMIFFRTATEKKLAQDHIDALNKSGKYSKPISAEVVRYTLFWPAEDAHQHYLNTHTTEPYVVKSIKEIAHYQTAHADLIKPGHNFAK
jgi:peptide-methionine (S)-S-oxide reductase